MDLPVARFIVILAAICLVTVSAHPISNLLYPSIIRRDGTPTDLHPSDRISLAYQSVELNTAGAIVQADLHLRSILLENLQDLTSVTYTPDSIVITFTSSINYEVSYVTWPRSDLLLITNHLENCDTIADRGFFRVNFLTFNNDTLTVTASTEQTTLQEQASNVKITFDTTTSPKRDLSRSIDLDWSGDVVNTDEVKIHADQASVHSTIRISGVIEYNLETHTASNLQLETSLDLDTALDLHASAKGKLSRNLYTFIWSPIPMPGVHIPGILRVGPVLDISVGVDLATTGAADIISSHSLTSTGLAHLDLLNATQSSVSGFDPHSTAAGSILAKGNAQLDPFVEAGLGFGLHLFESLLDLSSGVKARGTLANVFNVNADETHPDSEATLLEMQEVCEHGYWYTSGLIFDVIGFVTQFYSLDLYHTEIPVLNSSCVHFQAISRSED